jgi:hypothetical protein
MKLIDIIESLKTREAAEQLAASKLPGINYWLVDLYMENEIDTESKIEFINGRSVSHAQFIELEGKKYNNFFQLDEAQQLVQDFVNLYGKDYDNKALADRLYSYWLNDA